VLDTTIRNNTICVGHHYPQQHNMCWTPLSATTQCILDTTIHNNTICVGYHYPQQHNVCWTPLYAIIKIQSRETGNIGYTGRRKANNHTTHYVLDTTIRNNTICVGHHYPQQHNVCWTPLSATTHYVLDTTIRNNTICVGHHYPQQDNIHCVVADSGVQHILSCCG
jgi:hypothetical protein